jgi:hypothetical protein
MAGELPNEPLKVASAEDQDVVEAPPRVVLTQRSANAFAFGARIGVLMISAPSTWRASSKAPENFESRSRIANRMA